MTKHIVPILAVIILAAGVVISQQKVDIAKFGGTAYTADAAEALTVTDDTPNSLLRILNEPLFSSRTRRRWVFILFAIGLFFRERAAISFRLPGCAVRYLDCVALNLSVFR